MIILARDKAKQWDSEILPTLLSKITIEIRITCMKSLWLTWQTPKKNQQSSAPIQTPSQSRGLSHVSQGVCNRCPLGTSRGANSSGGCSLCSAESYADELGLDECKPCPSRSSQAWMGTLQTMELRFSEMDLMLWFSTSDVKLYKLAKWS